MIHSKNELLRLLCAPVTQAALQCAKEVVVKDAGMFRLQAPK
jgi:hypothetical protein